MTTPLAEQRTRAVAELAELERGQGAALLDGGPFDPSLIAAKHGELTVIAAAESEAHRRGVEAEAAEAAARRATAATEARGELDALTAAMASAEQHSAALVADLAAIARHGATLGRLCHGLGSAPPPSLDAMELQKTLSRIIGESLQPLGKPRRYGYLQWPSSIGKPTWGAEASCITAAIEPLLGVVTK